MILTYNNQWLIYNAQVFDNFAEPVRYVYTGPNVSAAPTSGIYDTTINLTHSTPQGYDFVEYSATGATLDGDTFKIGDTDVYVEGVFTDHYYTISTSSSHGTITANYNTAKHGTTITLSNSPATGYDFDYYEVVGATLINDNQFVIGYSDVTVIGHFKQHIYNVTVQSTNGTVTASPSSGVHGTTVTLSNTPASGYAFDYYTVTGATLNNNKFTIGYSDVTVVGHFKSALKHATVHLRFPDIADTFTSKNKTWYPYYIFEVPEVVSYTGDDISYLTGTLTTFGARTTDSPLFGSETQDFAHTGTVLNGSKSATIKVYANSGTDQTQGAFELRARSNVRNDVIYLNEYNNTTEQWQQHQVNPRYTQDAAGCWNYGRGQGVLAYEGDLATWVHDKVITLTYTVNGNTYCLPNPIKSHSDIIADLTWEET